MVLEPETRRLRRGSPPILQRLADLRDLPPAAMLAAEVQRAGAAGTSLQALSRLSALAPPRVRELLQPQPVAVTAAGLVVRQAELDGLVSRIPSLLARRPEGLPQEALSAALPKTGAAVLEEALGRLVARGVVVRRGGQLTIPRPDEDRARARDEAELAALIAESLRQAGLTPPDPKAIVTDLSAKRAVDRLLRDGVVVRAVDRAKRKEILFHQEAIAEAQARLAPLLERSPGLLPTEVGVALGISRKYSMPLLDHLDTIRFTRRVDDRRMLHASNHRTTR
jgi:selenocysteine-specific elongation factor